MTTTNADVFKALNSYGKVGSNTGISKLSAADKAAVVAGTYAGSGLTGGAATAYNAYKAALPQIQAQQAQQAATNTLVNNYVTNNGATLTPNIAYDLLQNSMLTGVPTSLFNKYGGYDAVNTMYQNYGGQYTPSQQYAYDTGNGSAYNKYAANQPTTQQQQGLTMEDLSNWWSTQMGSFNTNMQNQMQEWQNSMGNMYSKGYGTQGGAGYSGTATSLDQIYYPKANNSGWQGYGKGARYFYNGMYNTGGGGGSDNLAGTITSGI